MLFTFENEATGKSYIVYTDNSIDENGNTAVMASVYAPEVNEFALLPIETEEEWDVIEQLLDELTSQADDEE